MNESKSFLSLSLSLSRCMCVRACVRACVCFFLSHSTPMIWTGHWKEYWILAVVLKRSSTSLEANKWALHVLWFAFSMYHKWDLHVLDSHSWCSKKGDLHVLDSHSRCITNEILHVLESHSSCITNEICMCLIHILDVSQMAFTCAWFTFLMYNMHWHKGELFYLSAWICHLLYVANQLL
jgi:hypothetical protein